MSAREPNPAPEEHDDWADLSAADVAELERRVADADEHQRNGAEGIPARAG